MNKQCFRCKKTKNIEQYYKHPGMLDGHLGKCIDCTKKDASKRTIDRICDECGSHFMTWPTEIRRGGGLTCSRSCYYKRFTRIVKRENESPNWRGNEVGRAALHNWVERNLGKPRQCAKCKRTDCNKFEWANISRKYKRNLKDWIRLCKRCHIIFDGSKNYKNYPRLTYKQFLKIKII